MAEELLREAERYLEESMKERDPRRRAEKGHLAATLAADALIVHRGRERPRSIYERRKILDEIDPKIEVVYGNAVDYLHRKCFYEGMCIPDIVDYELDHVSEMIQKVKRVVHGSE